MAYIIIRVILGLTRDVSRQRDTLTNFMSEIQDDEELQSEEAESEDVEVNRVFEDQDGFPIAFFLHKSIKKSFARRNLTRDILVRPDSIGSHLPIYYLFAETRRNCAEN